MKTQINFPIDKIKLIEKNFNLIDGNGDKKINTEEFKILIRLFGQTKTDKEIYDIINHHFEDEAEKAEDNKHIENNSGKIVKANGGETSKNNIVKKNGGKTPPNHDRIKNLINKLNNFNDDYNIRNNGIKTNEKNLKTANVIEKGETKPKKDINFETFMKIFINTYTEPISLSELIKSFETLDSKKTGYVDESTLKHIMISSDEQINNDDINLFMNSLNFKDTKKIDYILLSKKLKNIIS
ncbi:calmodulin, putative [Plasmodium berghei]|uniref:Calmodulin n=2 Tax=Plasmodium berghei TaxID=5821 RepID=A0A509AGC4_PLABA|nr:calmodulin, putative [Plasmodium berghei ANKA]SCL93072.1 calmodulin, putative [Plasmodium berghei]SCM15783.1 calmodulin, putative [Plasmodium berghei]SCM17578.1 calmodulin, putative [Plasmodium berghei]SCN23045.1 calmodulin, putative [Plasmodium berghei]VUC54560.1 calmodulin, putative [Plasmodium berghei ANKA]|eukprot:XP_034420389.1 calmodulin, putative [Plasmodium berghei ANKA]